MSLRHSILSLLLLFFVLLLGIKNYEVWTLPVELVPEKGETKKSGVKIENPPTTVGKKETTSIESYIFVAEKNIFNPERKDFPVIAPPPPVAEVKKPIVRPQIILYGVTMVGDYQSASVVNPGRPLKKGERELMTLKVGDQIGEYKLAKILPDRIAMETTEDKFEVLLYDSRIPKQRTFVKTEVKPAAITSTLPGPVAPAAAPAAATTGGAPARAPVGTIGGVLSGSPRPPGSSREASQSRSVTPPAVTPTPTSTPPAPSTVPRPRITREPGIFGPVGRED